MCVEGLVCILPAVVEIKPKELRNEHRQAIFLAEFQLSFKFGMPIQHCTFLARNKMHKIAEIFTQRENKMKIMYEKNRVDWSNTPPRNSNI
jgi:hypothetical protein